MAYFNHFPLVRYGEELQLNLTRRVGINSEFKNNPAYYYNHNIVDGDTPENIADKFYDDAELSWIIIQFNDIVNVFEQWPMTQTELERYVHDKYDNPYAIHHYVSISSGAIITPESVPSYDRFPVTNFDYEILINDAKRPIKLVLPEYAGAIVNSHREMMRRGV